MSEENEKKMIGLLTELLKWNKFVAISAVKDIAIRTLKTDAERIVFEHSDGKKSSVEIGALAGVSHMTVVNYWKKWDMLGIVIPAESYKGRYKRICSLAELGIDVPESVKIELKEGDINGNTRGTADTAD